MARKSVYPASVVSGIPRLGPRPEGWRTVAFNDVLQIVERPAVLNDTVEYQLVTVKRNRGGIVPREKLKGHQIKTKSQFFVREGDFLISKRQIIHGACGIVPKDLDGAIVSGEYLTLRAMPGLLVDYMEYYSNSIHFQQTCFYSSVGVDVEKMVFNEGEWLRQQFHLPPLPEQRRIAEILRTWDEATETYGRLIAKKRLFLSILAQRTILNYARIVVPLGEVCEFRSGSAFKEIYQGRSSGEHPFIKVSDMNLPENGKFIVTAQNWVSAEDLKAMKARLMPPEAVVFAKVGAALKLNRKRILTRPTAIDNNMMAAVANSRFLDSSYLYFFLNTQDLGQFTQEGAVPSINQQLLASLRIPLPSLDEQRQIVRTLTAVDEELSLLIKLQERIGTQKRGLMQKLLTGALRVKVD